MPANGAARRRPQEEEKHEQECDGEAGHRREHDGGRCLDEGAPHDHVCTDMGDTHAHLTYPIATHPEVSAACLRDAADI